MVRVRVRVRARVRVRVGRLGYLRLTLTLTLTPPPPVVGRDKARESYLVLLLFLPEGSREAQKQHAAHLYNMRRQG